VSAWLDVDVAEGSELLIERHDHVVVLTLNRPDALNALNAELTNALYDAFDEIEGNFPDHRVVVLTGNGRGFCSGADVNRLAAGVRGELPRTPQRRTIVELAPRLRSIPQPIVAAVNGVAAGAGLALALASDIRIASSQASFASIFVKRALVPDTATTYTLQRLVGPGVASEMALTGRVIDVEYAREVGLVNRVVAPERLLDEALELAAEVAANPPVAVQHTKRLIDRVAPDLMELVRIEAETNRQFADSRDRREAILAFIEKRTPLFTGS
jgi:2-(1,2-epoxy-1,2-dihydrophenyl)acetyl-CoA isomerase